MKKKLILVFSLAFIIRFIALNQSLWLDEATTAKVVQTYSYLDIVTKFSPNDFHPPLYYLLMKLWTNIVGYSEVALRFPSVLFSLMTGYMVYKIAKLLNGSIVGVWAAAFFLFNPLIIYYSQEARMYMMTVFFLTIALYYFLKLGKKPQTQISKLKSQNWNNIILFNLFCILSFYTFYGSIFLIVSMQLLLLFKKQYKIFFVSCFVFYVSCLILSPLLYQQWIHARESLQIVMNWKHVLGTASLKNLFLIPLKFSSGRISFSPKLVYYALSGLWAFLIWFTIFRGGIKNKRLLFLLITPLILGLLFSFFSPLLQYFRFLYLIPLMSILLSIADKRALYDRTTHVIVIVGFLSLSLVYLLLPQFHREDWRSLSKTLSQARFIYMIVPSSDPVKYYVPTISIRELRLLDGTELEKELTVIPYTTDIYGFDYKKELKKHGFTYKETRNFRGVWYEIWVRNKGYAWVSRR